MKIIDNILLDQLMEQAKNTLRLRMNHNFHHSPCDPVQQMLNAIEPNSYLRPHRHPDVDELFLLLRGRGVVLSFDDQGDVLTESLLSPEQGRYGVQIPASTWHSIISLESGTTIFEVKPGPYRPLEENHFAPWTPKPDDAEGIERFFDKYRKCLS